MMELFDKKFVHFMWDDELEGKKCFIADGIDDLRGLVEKLGEDYLHIVLFSGNESAPFQSKNGVYAWKFAYYDPNYEAKKAFNEGKKVQICDPATDDWVDCDEPLWLAACKYREKPEEEKWIAYLARETNGSCFLSACAESCWKTAQKALSAKTKLFVGTESEVDEWYKARQKFAGVIKAWEDGKTIQFLNCGQWEDCRGKPLWHLDNAYRAKPEEKRYRSYINSAEMIADFIARFKVKCPSYAEPLIWVKSKKTDSRYLITTFCESAVTINTDPPEICSPWVLFVGYTYLDGSPVGMEC